MYPPATSIDMECCQVVMSVPLLASPLSDGGARARRPSSLPAVSVHGHTTLAPGSRPSSRPKARSLPSGLDRPGPVPCVKGSKDTYPRPVVNIFLFSRRPVNLDPTSASACLCPLPQHL